MGIKEFNDLQVVDQPLAKRFHKSFLLFFLLTAPWMIRFVLYNVVYDLPLGWFVWSIVSLLILITFSHQTIDGLMISFYRDSGILVKYLLIIIMPIMITSIVEDFKISYNTVIHHELYKNKNNPVEQDTENNLNLIYDALSVINKIGGQMIYIGQLPFLGIGKNFESVRIYQVCLIKKMQGNYSDEEKERAYHKYFTNYLQNSSNQFAGQIVQASFWFRLKKTLVHIWTKVILFQPFEMCS